MAHLAPTPLHYNMQGVCVIKCKGGALLKLGGMRYNDSHPERTRTNGHRGFLSPDNGGTEGGIKTIDQSRGR